MATIDKIPKCPPLRFPDFNDDWKETTLGEIGVYVRGLTYTADDIQESGYIVIRANNITEGRRINFDTELVQVSVAPSSIQVLQDNDIAISMANGSSRLVGKASYYNGYSYGTCTVGAFCGIFRSSNLLTRWLFQTPIYSRYIYESIQGGDGAIANLKGEDILRQTYSLPSLAEQKKIADFLSLIDERITNLSETIRELKNQKAALLNQLFSQKLRFPDFNDEWTQTTLGEILLEVSERNSKNINRVISSTINGLFDQKEYFNRDIASKDISNYKILKRNQLVLSPQNIWMGNINVNLSFDVGIVSPSYKIYSLDHDSIDFRFASYALKTPVILQRYKDSSSQGASVVRRNLDIDSFYSVTLPLPTLSEQKKIADFLSLIDERIEVEEQLLQQYEKQKRYLLKQMFV